MTTWEESILSIRDEFTQFRYDFTKYIDKSAKLNGYRFFWEMLPMLRFANNKIAPGYTNAKKEIYLNIPWKTIETKKLKWLFIYYHECLHQLFDTFKVEERIKKEKNLKFNHDVLNVASDCVINEHLHSYCNMPYPSDKLITPEYLKEKFGVEYDKRKDTQFDLYVKLIAKVKEIENDPVVQQMRDGALKSDAEIEGGGGGQQPKTNKIPTSDDWKRGSKEARKAANDILEKYSKLAGKKPGEKLSKEETIDLLKKALPEIEALMNNPIAVMDSYIMASNEFIKIYEKQEEFKDGMKTYEEGWDYAINDVVNQVSQMIDQLENGEIGGGGGTPPPDDNEEQVQDVPENDPTEEKPFLPKVNQTGSSSMSSGDDSDDSDSNSNDNQDNDESEDSDKNNNSENQNDNESDESEKDPSDMTSEEAAQYAKSSAQAAQKEASQARQKANDMKQNSDGSNSDEIEQAEQNAQDAEDAAQRAQDAADKAQEAAENGDLETAQEEAQNAKDAAREAKGKNDAIKDSNNKIDEPGESIDEPGEDTADSKNVGSEDKGSSQTTKDNALNADGVDWNSDDRETEDSNKQWGDFSAEVKTYAKKIGEMSEAEAKKIIRRFAKGSDPIVKDFVRKCEEAETKEEKGVIVNVKNEKVNYSWANSFSDTIKNVIKQKVHKRVKEWEETYARPNRRQGIIHDGDIIKKGKKPLKNKMTISMAFYVDRSGSMRSNNNIRLENIMNFIYGLSDTIMKKYHRNPVVEECLFRTFVFDEGMTEVKRPYVPSASGGTDPLHRVLSNIIKRTPNAMINVIITDAEMDFNISDIKSKLNELSGMVVFITNDSKVAGTLKPLDDVTTSNKTPKFKLIKTPENFDISASDFANMKI